MKKVLLVTFAVCASALLQAQTPPPQPVISVTLLGTGVPLLDPVAYVASGRVNAGLMIEAGTERMLFDCGEGILNRLLQSGGPTDSPNVAVDKVFISHLHSDHMADLPALYAYGWFFRQAVPLRVWGPGPGPNGIGMSTIMPLLRLAWDTDFRIRCCTFTDTNLDFPLSGVKVEEQDLKEGVVYSHNGVKVTAFKVDHRPVQPAFGFRVDYQGKSVVFSGDTRLSENLIKHSVGVNLLIHEVYGFARDTGAEIFDYHTPPEDAARIFNADAPELAVYTHMGIPPGNTFKDIESRTRAAGYLGPLQSGADLMQINVMANGVTVIPPAANAAAKPAVVPNVQSQQLKRMVP